MVTVVTAICIGIAQPFNGVELSAIDKRPVAGDAAIRSFGIEGDMVGDPTVHGGRDMAVHHYPTDHYAGWDAWLGGHELLRKAASFGENLMSTGLTERDVCIGDRFRFGTALLEVSQPRQPCWKIEHRFDRKGMVARIVEQGMCGWYYRVIEEGQARAGDSLRRDSRAQEEWSVARTFAAFLTTAKNTLASDWRSLSALEPLSRSWRDKAARHV